MDPILSNLNDQQQQVVTAELSNLLVLAGAGSGKTRVLVHRLAWLLQHHGVSPYHLLAVTFTNKAAQEIKNRLETLFDLSTQGMWVGTFHGLAHRLLSIHYQACQLPQAFQVLDADDQYRLVRRVMHNLNLDEKRWPPKQAQNFINRHKEKGLRPSQITPDDNGYDINMVAIYMAYQKLCDQSGLVDFAELLLKAYELLQQDEVIRQQYQQRFQHILVDEFQDTNTIQYQWLQLLAKDSHMMVVGDDDQSIYSWRGAKSGNIKRFQHDLAPVKLIRLEQNYRSTQTILNAANAVIANNSDRLGKKLWTNAPEGQPIQLYAAFNELDEAHFIVSHIKTASQNGMRHADIAVLYRSNAQSRVVEEACLQQGVPYRVYGGLRFFERAEIKNTLAYLRLIHHRHDDAAFERIVNTPTRGIGEKCMTSLRDIAQTKLCSLWQAGEAAIQEKLLSTRLLGPLQKFLSLIEKMSHVTANLPLDQQVEHSIKHAGLIEFYQQEPGEKGQSRIENLGELITAARQFTTPSYHHIEQDEDITPLAAFLSLAVLESGESQTNSANSVQLMTLHASKGLEFPMVFMCGMEEQIFPSHQSISDPQRLAEERRLCYVGMTRAMQQLTLSYAEYRRLYGENRQHFASRFIQEIPAQYLHEIRMKTTVSQPVSIQRNSPRRFRSSATTLTNTNGQCWQVGQHIKHPKFGEGVILNYEGQGDNGRLHINFVNMGKKWIVPSFTRLEKIC